ncbi:hypothetical protein [Streptomyces platensis]|uniref:hypothetical protein n=1 Tax=Streptomyces platensis TaxID=58346 RepID=UPI001F1AECD2|nr:hypothetical protein [Streptomyces platensis]MCF3145636.1 hypothetical protein [Streptomyces platensis]
MARIGGSERLVGAVHAGSTGLTGVCAMLGGVALLGALVAATCCEETAGRTLEELSP